MKASLTVFFEDPFWVGVFERIEDGKLSVCKVTFGAEPKDYDVWDYVLHHYYELVFSPAIETETRQTADNPKRRLRNARKHLEKTGIGTKSQQALQRQREEMKTERRQISREEREAEARRRFEMKQTKKKEKRRGHIKVQSGQVTDLDQCECSRQSILYILSCLEPDSKFEVEILETILRGAEHCRFQITKY